MVVKEICAQLKGKLENDKCKIEGRTELNIVLSRDGSIKVLLFNHPTDSHINLKTTKPMIFRYLSPNGFIDIVLVPNHDYDLHIRGEFLEATLGIDKRSNAILFAIIDGATLITDIYKQLTPYYKSPMINPKFCTKLIK